MELKFASFNASRYWSIVLIVPLWNWNSNNATACLLAYRSNRTFMELKYEQRIEGQTACFCSNRTFMELKYIWAFQMIQIWELVLIVPLWNWNNVGAVNEKPLLCSNRTFMELKLLKIMRRASQRQSSNRTFMELKYGSACLDSTSLQYVLIVPLWNWNRWRVSRDYWQQGSNRTFMELKFQTVASRSASLTF